MIKAEFVLIGFSQKLSNVKEVPDITINYEIPVQQVTSAKSLGLTIQ